MFPQILTGGSHVAKGRSLEANTVGGLWGRPHRHVRYFVTVVSGPGNRERLLRLGGREFLVIAALLLGLAGVLVIVVWPDVQRAWARHAIRHREATYGFTTGDIPSTPSCPYSVLWGIVSVASEGEFDKAGVRSGDVPVFTHGGLEEVAYALEESEAGRSASFEVFNCSDANRQVTRMIHLSATAQSVR